MRTKKILAVCVIGFAMAGPAFAELESIGPITLVPGQPVDLFYPNAIPPHHTHKILQFIGTARLLDPAAPPTVNGLLEITFDYIDLATGGMIFIPAPGSPFPVFGGGLVTTIATPEVMLPFCPQQVSIHFEAVELPMIVEGVFRHECVPEPATIGLLALGAVAGAIRKRRALPA